MKHYMATYWACLVPKGYSNSPSGINKYQLNNKTTLEWEEKKKKCLELFHSPNP
jgi:hypothetical protein